MMPDDLPAADAPRSLLYTVCLDAPGREDYRWLGKMLVWSLVRTGFTGEMMVFHNGAERMFPGAAAGLTEIALPVALPAGPRAVLEGQRWKYKAGALIDRPEQYGKILFLDADSLALRNIDHLLEGDWDIRYQPERMQPASGMPFHAWLTDEEMQRAAQREGINSGTFAVRGAVFREVMHAWQAIDTGTPPRDSPMLEQAAWNALLLRNEGRVIVGSAAASPHQAWKAEPFPMGEVQFPGFIDLHPASYTKAAITHNIMPDVQEKVAFTFGLYMRTFYAGRMREMLELL